MRRILKGDLTGPSKFKRKFLEYIQILIENVKKESDIDFDIDELSDLILSECRAECSAEDFNIIYSLSKRKMFLDERKVLNWIKERLIPTTIVLSIDEEDVIRLLIFCIEITYQMFGGGTRATVTQKGFRQRRRTFESIVVDQFVGKLGEIFVKKFLEEYFPTKIKLDWEISTEIEKYRNDIMNAKKRVSIKSSLSLAGIWAEADFGYDYGITVKCSVPEPTILQFFIEVCGFSRLLDFADNKIPPDNGLFKNYLEGMRERIKDYKCGEIQTKMKGFICGYFKTSEYETVEEGEKLDYLGEVREERYLVPINELKYTIEDWAKFLTDVELI